MQWVAVYFKANKSHRFYRELEAVQCKSDNETMKVLEYLDTVDCKKSAMKPRLSPALTTNFATKSTESVPVELNSQKSKPETSPISVAESTDEAYLSDTVNERAQQDDSGNRSDRLNVQFYLSISLISLALILGTMQREM